MKRYGVFTGYDYEASGGWNDFDSEWDSRAMAENQAKSVVSKRGRWAHLVDFISGEIIGHFPQVSKEEQQELLGQLIDAGLVQIVREGGPIPPWLTGGEIDRYGRMYEEGDPIDGGER